MIELAQGWRDYVLLDAGDGEKLEVWGDIKVIRPDPQAFWPRSQEIDWSNPDMHYHRSKAGGGHWDVFDKANKKAAMPLCGGFDRGATPPLGDGNSESNFLANKKIPQAWKIGYKGLKFHIRPTGFKHMGLFPEQAVNWCWLTDKILDFSSKESESKKMEILNLFAYTGGATVACLKAGANVTHIDAAKGMNQWARDNITLSGLSNTKHRIMTDDVLKFVQREARRGKVYDGIILDPPVFGRGPSGEMWKLEDKLFSLVEACANLLSNHSFILVNAYTAGFSSVVYGNILELVAKKLNLAGNVSINEIGLSAKSGVVLPCGMYARWEKQ